MNPLILLSPAEDALALFDAAAGRKARHCTSAFPVCFEPRSYATASDINAGKIEEGVRAHQKREL